MTIVIVGQLKYYISESIKVGINGNTNYKKILVFKNHTLSNHLYFGVNKPSHLNFL